MTRTSFLARKSLGQPHYLLIAMACAFVLAFVPIGVRGALRSTKNKAEDWLPAAYDEVQDLAWFRKNFGGEQFALVSWDGCTLGNAERLELLARKLAGGASSSAAVPVDPSSADRTRWYARITTGPRVIRNLMNAHAGVSYDDAIKRLEGALVGPAQRNAEGRLQGHESRVTCLVVHLSPAAMRDNETMREAVDGITRIATSECGIDASTIHMGGPPVDNATIDAEGTRTLVRLAPLAGIAGVCLCYWRLRSARLTALVVAVGAVSAGVSLAIVFYFGVLEVAFGIRATPDWGTLDAVLTAMPAIVYLLATSAALHSINYYFEMRHDRGLAGAAEESVSAAWRPTMLAALATAAGLAALATGDIVPMRKFGVFTALALIALMGVLFGVVPVVLHRFPLDQFAVRRRSDRRRTSRLAVATDGLFRFVVERNAATLAFWSIVFVVLALGMTRLQTSVQVLNMLDRDADLVKDYGWLEENLGHLVPMEVVITIPPERLRTGEEHAEADGQQYRLTMLERLELLRQIERRLEAFPQISRALSAATFAPGTTETGLDSADRSGDYAKNKALEQHRDKLLSSDYLRIEGGAEGDPTVGRELWRVNARVAAQSKGEAAVDYGKFVEQLRRSVDPVLLAYQQRDLIVRALHEQGKQLAGARVCVLFRAPNRAPTPPTDVQEQALAELLSTSGLAPRGISYFNIAAFQAPGRGNAAQDEQYRVKALESLRLQDAVILASAPSDPVAKQIAASGVHVVDVTRLARSVESTAAAQTDDGGPRPIRAVFSGLAPVLERAQGRLLGSLQRGLFWAVGLVAALVTLAYMSVPAGLLAAAPCFFPLAATFGMMGWLGVKVDLGIAMTAAVALGLAVEGAVHFINWFRRGLAQGLPRPAAAMQAYDRCGVALMETALITALGLAVLGLSPFTPVRQFGLLMVAMLAAALAGNLLMLPAILASPAGWFFAPADVRRRDPLWPKVQAWWESRRPTGPAAIDHPRTMPQPMPVPAPAPHFVEEPQPVRRSALSVSTEQRREMADGPHAALHAKLQSLRRPRTGDSANT